MTDIVLEQTRQKLVAMIETATPRTVLLIEAMLHGAFGDRG